MPRVIYDTADVIADWKTGNYTQRDIASKYKISAATANKIVKGVEKTIQTLVNKEIAIKQELAEHTEQEVNMFEKEVARQTKDILFFRNATMENVSVMMSLVKKDAPLDPYQHKVIQDAIKSGKETVFGKQPELIVNNNNQVARFDLSSATAHEQSLMIELLEGKTD